MGNHTIYTNHQISKRPNTEPNFVKIQLPSETEANFTNHFVKNIDSSTEEEFEKLFTQYGSIGAYSLQKDEEGNVRGFGFVNFLQHNNATEALKTLNNSLFKDIILIVTRAIKKHELDEEMRLQYEDSKFKRMKNFAGKNLHIKHLDISIDDEKL